MHIIRLACAGFVIATLAAGATKPPEPVADFAPDYDFSQPKTIAFYALSGSVTGNNPSELTDFQRDRIDSALRGSLEAKGLVFVENTSDADLLLSWHLNLMEKTDVKSYNNPSYGASMGYSRYNRYSMYNCYNCMGQTDVRVTEYTQGTFILDMIDPEEKASVWRSVTQSKLKEETIRDGDALSQQVSEDLFSITLFVIALISVSFGLWAMVMQRRMLNPPEEDEADQTDVVAAEMEQDASLIFYQKKIIKKKLLFGLLPEF